MKEMLSQVSLFFLFMLLISCGNNPDTEGQEHAKNNTPILNDKSNQNLNISFLLDLSDRIDPKKYPNESMEFYLRDVAYIKSVSEALDIHLRKKKVREMNDKIQVFFDPEPQNQNINSISKDLRYVVSRENASIALLDKIKKVYASKPLEIYDLAINDNSYIGSDTWKFFKTKVKDFCIEDNYRNVLVIMTDGYIYHKDSKRKEGNSTTYLTPQDIRNFKLNTNDWEARFTKKEYGFIPATEGLENLEILVLGINPDKKNPYEEDVIMKYWTDWFNIMHVARYDIKTAGLPSDMDKIIKQFILDD